MIGAAGGTALADTCGTTHVAGSSGQCKNLRSSAQIANNIIMCVASGTPIHNYCQHIVRDGYTWTNVSFTLNGTQYIGWMATGGVA